MLEAVLTREGNMHVLNASAWLILLHGKSMEAGQQEEFCKLVLATCQVNKAGAPRKCSRHTFGLLASRYHNPLGQLHVIVEGTFQAACRECSRRSTCYTCCIRRGSDTVEGVMAVHEGVEGSRGKSRGGDGSPVLYAVHHLCF